MFGTLCVSGGENVIQLEPPSPPPPPPTVLGVISQLPSFTYLVYFKNLNFVWGRRGRWGKILLRPLATTREKGEVSENLLASIVVDNAIG